MLGIKGRHSHGSESQLDETELDMLTNRGQEIGSAEEDRGDKDWERLNSFRSSHGPALQGSFSDVTFSGNHSSHVLCKKKGTCWVPSLYPQTWTPVILAESRFYKKYESVFLMTWMPNQKEVSFPCQGQALRSPADLPWRVVHSVFLSKMEEHVIRLRLSKKASWFDLLPSWSWRTCSVCGFTEHCRLFSWEALRRKTLCRCD